MGSATEVVDEESDMTSVLGTLLATIGLLVGMIALGLILYASGLTGARPASGLLVVGIVVFFAGVFAFGYGTASNASY
jgi:hypothetical protein